MRSRDWTSGVPSLWYVGRVGVTTANQLNLNSLDRKPCAIGGLSRSSRGRIPEPVWQSQRMRRCVEPEARYYRGGVRLCGRSYWPSVPTLIPRLTRIPVRKLLAKGPPQRHPSQEVDLPLVGRTKPRFATGLEC
jgi:hypothetical protein